jgi:hypothetical protein
MSIATALSDFCAINGRSARVSNLHFGTCKKAFIGLKSTI